MKVARTRPGTLPARTPRTCLPAGRTTPTRRRSPGRRSRLHVRTVVGSADPPVGSAVDPFDPAIQALVKECNTIPATVIAERIGWTRGLTILEERLAN